MGIILKYGWLRGIGKFSGAVQLINICVKLIVICKHSGVSTILAWHSNPSFVYSLNSGDSQLFIARLSKNKNRLKSLIVLKLV